MNSHQWITTEFSTAPWMVVTGGGGLMMVHVPPYVGRRGICGLTSANNHDGGRGDGLIRIGLGRAANHAGGAWSRPIQCHHH